jgi:glycosyltransferase involved in cell wall biosynthesis
MIFYIFDNNDFSEYFFKNKNFELLILNDYLNESNIKFNDDDICIFNLNNFNMIYLHKNTINIFLLKKNLYNISLLDNFTYIYPINVKLYYDYFLKLKNLLLPVNINNIDFDTYFAKDKSYLWIKKRMKSKFVEDGSANLIAFDNYSEINMNDLNKMIIKVNSKLIKQSIYEINNISIFSKAVMLNVEIKAPTNIHYTKVEFENYDNEFKMMLKADKVYLILPKNTTLIKNIDSIISNFIQSRLIKTSFLVRNNNNYQLAFLYKPKRTNTYTIIDLMKIAEYHHDLIIGENQTNMSIQNIFNIYNLLGQIQNYSLHKNLCDYDNYYYDCIIYFIQKINRPFRQKFNYVKFIRIISFWAGLNNYNLNFSDIETFYNANLDLFNQRKILLTSKAIKDYGGNQKTGLQIYKDLVGFGFDVKICCLSEHLVIDIDPNDIIKIKKIAELEQHINSIDYEFVFVNKLDEILDIVEKLNKKIIFLTHNSTDPVNGKIIEKSKYLYKIFTVNYEHIEIFLENNINNKLIKYINYIETNSISLNRDEFKYNILYIGRLSQEKNINLLISAFNKFTNMTNMTNMPNMPNKKIQLNIIGDGKYNIDSDNSENINFLGRANKHKINLYLQNSDYVVLPSSTEGLPFAILEAFSMGIPVISSNIVGCNELVFNDKTGFTFDIPDYIKYKNNYDNWSIMQHFNNNIDKISENLANVFIKAYDIPIENWNLMSNNCVNMIKSNYNVTNKLVNINNILNDNLFAIITKFNYDENLNKIFDMYKDNNFYNKYNLVIQIEDIQLLNQLIYYISKEPKYLNFILNNIMKEMYIDNVSKIIDKNNNLINNYSVKSNLIKNVDILLDIFNL